MARTKEQMATEIITESRELLDNIKATANRPPARKGVKKPAKSKKTTSTHKTSEPIYTPAPVHAELVHAPVSGSGINGVVRGDVSRTSPQTMAEALTAIQEQQNTVLISQANHKLDKAIATDQGLELDTQLVQEKNATKAEAISTQAMKTRQQSAKTQIEGVRLQGLNIDLEGESALLTHRQEGWAIKSEEMAIDNAGARSLLEPRREHWSLKLQLAQVGLQKLNMQIQQEMSEMYAPQQAITQHDD